MWPDGFHASDSSTLYQEKEYAKRSWGSIGGSLRWQFHTRLELTVLFSSSASDWSFLIGSR